MWSGGELDSAPLIKLHTVQSPVSVAALRYCFTSLRSGGGQMLAGGQMEKQIGNR